MYSENCRLNGYEEYSDWYLAWETYKYFHRKENIIKQKRYKSLYEAVEYIIVCHRMVENPQDSFENLRDFYRFYVTLAKNENEYDFVLTDEVEEYLLSIAKKKETV